MKVESKILLSFGLAFLAVLLVGGLTYGNNRALLRHNAMVVHTYEVLKTISALFAAAQDVETGTRGYMLTGRDDFLEPYHAGVSAIEGRLAELRGEVSDNPAQIARLNRLGQLLRRKIEVSEGHINNRRIHGIEAALAGQKGEGKRAMDELRAVVSEMRGVELAFLQQRSRESAASARNVSITFLALMAVAVLLLTVFFFQVRGDLAERTRVNSLLTANEQRFRGVLESAPDALVLTDHGGRITLVNPAFEKLFGVNSAAAIQRPLSDYLCPRETPPQESAAGEETKSASSPAEDGSPAEAADALDRLDPHLEHVLGRATGKLGDAIGGVRQREAGLTPTRLIGIREGGKSDSEATFPAEISQSVLSSTATGEAITITAIRDRTERERAERELRGFSEDLARSNAELERFAYVASHDLQEPLRMVSSYTQLLKRRYRGKLDSDAHEFIDFAVDGANRMQKLIQDLLTYSRVGSRPLELAPVDCEGILERVLRDMQETLEERGATVEHEPLPLVRGDAVQLGQLFQNLLANATKFVRPDVPPLVRISVSMPTKHLWQFAVQDNGIGIDPQYFERIFIIFQRLHGKDAYPGTGIGLAICKKIVERHGGCLWVESKSGAGAKFLFTLPAVDA